MTALRRAGYEDVREGASIHRGTQPESWTIIGPRCFILASAHIGHNCVLGDSVKVYNCAALSGHVEVGDFAGFVVKYMGEGGAGLFRVTYHRLGALRARWHCAVPGPSTQARHQHTRSVFHTGYNPEITIINLYLFRDLAPVAGLNFPSGHPS